MFLLKVIFSIKKIVNDVIFCNIASPSSSRWVDLRYKYIQCRWNHDLFINEIRCVLDAAQLLSSAKRRDYAQVERYTYTDIVPHKSDILITNMQHLPNILTFIYFIRLIKGGVDVNCRHQLGWTALHVAAINQDTRYFNFN